MLAVLRYSSNSRCILATAMMATTLLGGCSQTSGSLFASKGLFGTKSQAVEAAQVDDQAIVGTIDDTASSDIAADLQKPELVYSQPQTSAWCRYLTNNAAAEATIIASPTLSANTDDAGNGTLNIGMNLLDFKKADLVRQSADAKCQAYSAGKMLEAALKLSEETTKLAGYLARQKHIENRQGEMESAVAKAKSMTASGILTVQQENAISQLRHDLLADMNTARSEVDRRRQFPAVEDVELKGQNLALYDATSQLQAIDREIRTIDAFDISLQAGYRFNDGEALTSDQDDVYAKLKVGIRLGAVSRQRSHYEDAAATARLEALNEEGSGPLWKTGFATQAIENSLSGLRKAKSSLQAAKITTDDTAGKLNASDRPELIFSALQAKMTSIRIGADIAAVEASIREMENSKSKLGTMDNQ